MQTNNLITTNRTIPAPLANTNPSLRKRSTLRAFRLMLALSLVTVAAVPPLPAKVQAQSASTRENLLRQRLAKAKASYSAAASEVSRYPVFRIFGNIEGGNGRDAIIYGQAFGMPGTPANAMGWVTSKRFLTVRSYRSSDVDTTLLGGTYMAVAQTVYAQPPAAYYRAVEVKAKCAATLAAIQSEVATIGAAQRQAQQKVAQARQAKLAAAAATKRAELARQQEEEAQSLLADFQKNYGKEAATSTDPAFLQKYGEASLALYQKLTAGQGGGDVAKFYTPLRENWVVQNVRAATLLAEQGKLDQSAAVLLPVLWTGKVGFDGAQIQATPSDVKALKQVPVFSNLVYDLFERQSGLLGNLLAAWGKALPDFGERGHGEKVPYAEMLKVRAFAQALERCSQPFPLLQRGPLIDALNQKLGNGLVNGGANATADAPANILPTPPVAKEPRKPAMEFAFRDLKTKKDYKLSDFLGKVVVVYFADFMGEAESVSPSRLERIALYGKEYDRSQVVFLPILPEMNSTYLQHHLRQLTDPKLVDEEQRVRQYGDLFMLCSPLSEREATTPNQRKDLQMRDGATLFYTGSKSGTVHRVTVIDAKGLVVGKVDFTSNNELSNQNRFVDRKAEYSVYEFDKAALDALIVEALTPEQQQ